MRVLRVSETKPPPRNALLVALFALESQKNPEMTKKPSFGTPRGVWTCLLTLAPERCHLAVSRTTFVLAIFGNFLLFLEKKTKSIRFCTKFYAKAGIFLPSNCTSLLLRSKPVQRNWRHF